MAPVLVLVGAPGSGKTTVGGLVAGFRGLGFRDTDADVEAAAGCSISDIFVDEGESGFRTREIAAVSTAVAQHEGVLSVGGGAVESPQVRRTLAGLPVVWLTVGATEAGKRVGIHGPRPAQFGNIRAQWNEMMNRRAPLYDEVARWSVETDGRSPDQVAEAVVALLRGTKEQVAGS